MYSLIAGHATGIIVAAVISALLGLSMWIDLIVEYVAGFTFGLLFFSSWKNVRKNLPARVHHYECHDARHGAL